MFPRMTSMACLAARVPEPEPGFCSKNSFTWIGGEMRVGIKLKEAAAIPLTSASSSSVVNEDVTLRMTFEKLKDPPP